MPLKKLLERIEDLSVPKHKTPKYVPKAYQLVRIKCVKEDPSEKIVDEKLEALCRRKTRKFQSLKQNPFGVQEAALKYESKS